MKYIARKPRSYFQYVDEEYSFLPSLTVDDRVDYDTGLIDHNGFNIYRLQEPIGFLHFEDN